MDTKPSHKIIEDLEKEYPVNTEVELIYMDDHDAPPQGTRGRVIDVDDFGTIHVEWETGSILGALYKKDKINKLENITIKNNIYDVKETNNYPKIGELFKDNYSNNIYIIEEEIIVRGQRNNVFKLRNIISGNSIYIVLDYLKEHLNKIESKDIFKTKS